MSNVERARELFDAIRDLLRVWDPDKPKLRVILTAALARERAAALADDLPWSIILARLEAAVTKGQGIQRRALLDGLRKAAGLVCLCCLGDSTPTKEDTPYWWHMEQARGSSNHRCNAGPIHDEIAQMEKARR